MYFKFFSENRLKHHPLSKIEYLWSLFHIKITKRSLAGSSLSNLFSIVHSIKIYSPSFNFCWNYQLPHIPKYNYQFPYFDPFTPTASLDILYYWALFFSLNIHPYKINSGDSIQVHGFIYRPWTTDSLLSLSQSPHLSSRGLHSTARSISLLIYIYNRNVKINILKTNPLIH